MCTNAPKEVEANNTKALNTADGKILCWDENENGIYTALGKDARSGLADALEINCDITVKGKATAWLGDRLCLDHIEYQYEGHQGTLDHVNIFEAEKFRETGLSRRNWALFKAKGYLYKRDNGEYDIGLKNCAEIQCFSEEPMLEIHEKPIPRCNTLLPFYQTRLTQLRFSIWKEGYNPEAVEFYRIVENSCTYPEEMAFLIYTGCTASAENRKGKIAKSCRDKKEAEEVFSGLHSIAEKQEENILVKEYTLFACGKDEFGDFVFPVKQSAFTLECLAKALDWPEFTCNGISYVLIPSESGSIRIAKADSVIDGAGNLPCVNVNLNLANESPSQLFELGPMQRYGTAAKEIEGHTTAVAKSNAVPAVKRVLPVAQIQESVPAEKEIEPVKYAIYKYTCYVPKSDASLIEEGFAMKNAIPAVVMESSDISEVTKLWNELCSSAEKMSVGINVSEYAMMEVKGGEKTVIRRSSFRKQQVLEASGAEIVTAGNHKFAVISTEPAKKQKEHSLPCSVCRRKWVRNHVDREVQVPDTAERYKSIQSSGTARTLRTAS